MFEKKIKNIMVIGAGQMGAGIAQVAVQAGYQVIINDLQQELLDKGMTVISRNFNRSLEKGKISFEQRESYLKSITATTDLGAACEADLVIEAVIEKLETKTQIFQELDKICQDDTIFASNTSSLPITELASFVSRPDKFIGIHFMNPVPVMQLVEIIKGLATDEAVVEIIENLAKEMGKTPVKVNDYPGFVSNRVLLPMINEAVYCVFEGVASVEGVDSVMKLGMNHPMGPLALADLIGLDTCLAIMEVLYEGFGDSKYRPCPLLRKYVKAGWLGRKSGRGFYNYEN